MMNLSRRSFTQALAASETEIPFRVVRRLWVRGSAARKADERTAELREALSRETDPTIRSEIKSWLYAFAYGYRPPVLATVLHRPDTAEFAVLEWADGFGSALLAHVHDSILIDPAQRPAQNIDPERVRFLRWFAAEDEAVAWVGGPFDVHEGVVRNVFATAGTVTGRFRSSTLPQKGSKPDKAKAPFVVPFDGAELEAQIAAARWGR